MTDNESEPEPDPLDGLARLIVEASRRGVADRRRRAWRAEVRHESHFRAWRRRLGDGRRFGRLP